MSDTPTVLLSRIGVASSGEHGTVTVEVPKSIGPVRLIKQIGAGAMGVVWLGHHEVLARDVAVKFLLSGVGPGSGTEASETFNAFLQGARAAAALRHAGMTAVHDAGATGGSGGVSYIVMEYVDGPTLSDVMRTGPLPLPVARTVLAELCEVVAELHEHDLVHRDIKPSNIMVSPDGAAVLTDFGLACPMPAPEAWQAKTPTTAPVAGTPAYMAPEMFAGDVSARSDVYAVGATAFELLAVRCAYQGGLEEVKAAARAGVVPRGVLEEKGVPEGVIDAIERAMNKDAMFRPKTARRLAELFEKGFEAARIAPASAEEVQQVAFPGGVRAAHAPEPVKPASAGATMFDVVGRRAEEKRRSAPKLEAPPEEPRPAPVIDVAQPGPAPIVTPGKVAMRAQTVVARSPAAAKVSRRMRIYDATPVPWRRVVLSSAAGAFTVASMAAALQWVLVGPRLAAIEVGSLLGVLEASPVPVEVEGRTFSGNTPDLLEAFVSATFYVIPFVLCVLPALVLYHWFAFTRGGAWGRCEPVCGWCGHSVLGMHAGKCLECGRRTDDHGGMMDRPPARRWGARIVRYGVGVVAFALAAGAVAGLLGIVQVILGIKVKSWIFDAVASVCAFVPAMLAYHFVARQKAVLTGVTRCGRCGAPSLDIEHGQCARCEERERKRVVRAATPVSKAAKGAPIPWPLLLACVSVGTIVLVATVVVLERIVPSVEVLAGQVTEFMHAWDAYGGPGSYVVDGQEFSGTPNVLVTLVVDLIRNAGPSVVEGLLIFVVYHRLAFSRGARGRGWTCGWCGYEVVAAANPCCPECGRAFTDRGQRGDRPPARQWGPRLWASAWSAAALVLTLAAMVKAAKFVMTHWVSADAGRAVHEVLGGIIIALPTCLVGLIVYHVTARRAAVLDGAARCGKCGLPGDPVAGCGRCSAATA